LNNVCNFAVSRKQQRKTKLESLTMNTKPNITRCRWCNLDNPLYVEYHDKEWGVPVHDDGQLFEMLLLEGFQAGLSWECILNKREAFRQAFDGFDCKKVAEYDDDKLRILLQDKGIVRNRLKISAAVGNAKALMRIQEEFGSFDKYIWDFTNGKTIHECDKTSSPLSDHISADLKKRGMKFVGTTIIYSFLQAIGIINSHEEGCWRHERQM
jgi:DNA-3-methyladenine glycosylase I